MYTLFPSDGDDSRCASGRHLFNAGFVLSATVGFVLLAVVALSTYTTTVQHASPTEAIDLIASRASHSFGSPGVMGRPTLFSIPGPSPWKELAIAGLEAANTCGKADRDVSMKAHAGLEVTLANMSGRNKAVVARASKAMASRVNTVQEMPGVFPPLGFFDPLGFATQLSQGKLLFYREVELKHGRVCMLAALGILVAEQFHPLFGGDISIPAYIGFQAAGLDRFWIGIAAAIAIPEIASIKTYTDPSDQRKGRGSYIDSDTWTMKEDRVSGDLGFDPLGLKPADQTEFIEMQNKELAHGRLAMIATAGMIAQELVTKEKLF